MFADHTTRTTFMQHASKSSRPMCYTSSQGCNRGKSNLSMHVFGVTASFTSFTLTLYMQLVLPSEGCGPGLSRARDTQLPPCLQSLPAFAKRSGLARLKGVPAAKQCKTSSPARLLPFPASPAMLSLVFGQIHTPFTKCIKYFNLGGIHTLYLRRRDPYTVS